jgi:PAS domain S-box-containing protein
MAEGIHVLYVDDDPGLLEICKLFLEDGGRFTVDTVQSAPEALAILTKNDYDAIVSDFQMPDMDGIELLKRVRSSRPIIPFILFTGRGREEVVIEAINNGVDFYIQKGGDPEAQFAELAHKIRSAVLMRRTQMTLAEQEQRYHDLQNSSDLIQSVAPDGHFLFVNKKWLDTLGYREDELPHLTLSDIIHEESLSHCMDTFRRVSSGENPGIIDAVFRTRDGVRVYVEGMVNCKFIDGACTYTRGMFKDVTDRKKAEQELLQKNEDLNAAYEELTATEEELRHNFDELREKDEVLRESEEKFRALVELSLDGIFITDFSGNLLFVNRAAGSIVDVPDYEAMIGTRNVMEFVAPESQADVLHDIGQVALGIDAYLVHYKLVTATKRETWVECIGKRILFGDSPAMLVSMRDVTGRKRAEESVRESENKFAIVFRRSPVPLTLVSVTDGKFVDVNDTFSGVTGYSRDEVIGRTAGDLGIFADLTEYGRFVSAIREHQAVKGMELKCRIKTGGIRTCRFSSGVILMGGRPYILSSVEDVTERRNAEEALRESEEKFRSLIETSPDIIWEIDLQGKFRYVSPMVTTVMGYSPEELAGTRMIDLIPEQERSSVIQELSGYISSAGPVAPLEVNALHLDGRNLKIEIRPSRVMGADGTPQGFRGVARDITEHTATEAALRDSELLFREVFDNANDAVFLVERARDGPGKYRLVNNTAVRMLGYSKEEFLAMSPRDIVPEEIAKRIMAGVRKKLVSDGYATFESANRRKDGSIIPIEVSISAFRYKGMEVDLSIVRDITDRKRDMEALRQAGKKLNILSGITRHDIGNQLLTLNGYVKMLHKKIPDPSFEQYFSRITKASSQIGAMIQFTREYEKIGVDAPRWQELRTLVDTAGKDALHDQITLKNDLPATMEIFADLLIARVAYNLIDNAVRHGGTITTIRFSVEERDGNRIIVCADDGAGVAMEEKERIFDPGFGKNTGFGLAISREILDITGITIKETGEPGKGARFEITVPKGAYRFADRTSTLQENGNPG